MKNILIILTITLYSCKKDPVYKQKYLTFNSDSSNVYAINLVNNDTLKSNICNKVYEYDIIQFNRDLKQSDTFINIFNINYSLGYYCGFNDDNYNYNETNQYILYIK